MGSAPTKTHIPNRNGTKKGSAVYQARIFKRSWDSNINPARTGTSSTQERRKTSRLLVFHKITHQKVAIPLPPYLQKLY
jgi:hypothetical protein